jgi:hypothetical protein
MRIALPISRNFNKVEDLLNALHAFEARGIKEMQLVNSIEETENGGEKYAVFDFEAEKGILYTLVHNKIAINFLVKED